MQVSLDEATDPWGVYIERVEVNRHHHNQDHDHHIHEDDLYIDVHCAALQVTRGFISSIIIILVIIMHDQ